MKDFNVNRTTYLKKNEDLIGQNVITKQNEQNKTKQKNRRMKMLAQLTQNFNNMSIHNYLNFDLKPTLFDFRD